MKKIAIPVVQEIINDHFGHSDEFLIFKVEENNQIELIETLKTENGCGCKSNLTEELVAREVTMILAGNLGQGAKSKLNKAGIEVITGFSGNAKEAVYKWISGDFKYQPVICSGGHNNGHNCNHN
jgi:predicted Fe-Mo cluster-binding NifX family protein